MTAFRPSCCGEAPVTELLEERQSRFADTLRGSSSAEDWIISLDPGDVDFIIPLSRESFRSSCLEQAILIINAMASAGHNRAPHRLKSDDVVVNGTLSVELEKGEWEAADFKVACE